MDWKKISSLLLDQPSFRLRQIKKAVYLDLVESWDKVTTLPKDLRDKLNSEYPLAISGKVIENGDSVKAVNELVDGCKIESVLMRHRDARNTVCVSCAVGCPLHCTFCATGKAGFRRNLSSAEIISQVLFWGRYLKKLGERVDNVVFMGMGEPFLNYDKVLKAIRDLNDKEGMNIGMRHFSISTVGIVERIKDFTREGLEVNLAISLHAADDELRLRLMPIDLKYPLKKIIAAVDDYVKKTRRRVMFEYVMIDGVNDSSEDAEKLAALVRRPLCFVNLISYNPTGDFESSPRERIKKFREILEKNKITVTERYRFGRGIAAACGQLAGK